MVGAKRTQRKTSMDLDPTPGAKAGIAAIVGRANVGKSSLINAVLGEKVSIVSPIAQTTRNVVRGILTEPRGQIVFLDTPGVHKAESDLGKMMNRMARAASEGTDVTLLVLDAAEPPRDEDRGWMKRIARAGGRVVAVLNKMDVPGASGERHREAWESALADVRTQQTAGTIEKTEVAVEWHELSASTGAGVPGLVDRLFGILPEGPALFPPDVLTDFPRKLAIGDVVREKLYRHLRDELPHSVAVWVEELKEGEDGWDVLAQIIVAKASQKGIVIGHKGRLLRSVKRASDAELTAIYERPVRVKLWVVIEKDWNRNFWLLKKFGYAG